MAKKRVTPEAGLTLARPALTTRQDEHDQSSLFEEGGGPNDSLRQLATYVTTVPEEARVPVAEVPDLSFERSRRRFAQGA